MAGRTTYTLIAEHRFSRPAYVEGWPLRAIATSADGGRVAVASRCELAVVDLASSTIAGTVAGDALAHTVGEFLGRPLRAAVHGDTAVVWSRRYDHRQGVVPGRVICWRRSRGGWTPRTLDGASTVYGVATSPAGFVVDAMVAKGKTERATHLAYDWTGRAARVAASAERPLAWLADGTTVSIDLVGHRLVVCTRAGKPRAWPLPRPPTHQPERELVLAAISPDRDRVVLATRGGAGSLIFSTKRGAVIRELDLPADPDELAFSADGKLLLVKGHGDAVFDAAYTRVKLGDAAIAIAADRIASWRGDAVKITTGSGKPVARVAIEHPRRGDDGVLAIGDDWLVVGRAGRVGLYRRA